MSKLWKNILIYGGISLFSIAAIVCICCAFLIKTEENVNLTISCQESVLLELGESYTLPVECSDNKAVITLKSANEKIAQTNGLTIISNSAGSTVVRVSANLLGKTSSKNVNIIVRENQEPLSISLEQNVVLYKYAENYFDYIEFSANKPFQYFVTNENIVSIKNGKISALNAGETTITFYFDEEKSIHNIRVFEVTPTLVVNTEDNVSVKVGKSINISYGVYPVFYTGEAKVDTVVEDESIACIENKTLTGLQVGSTKVKFYLNNTFVKEICLSVTANQSAIITPPTSQTNEENQTENQDVNEENQNVENSEENQESNSDLDSSTQGTSSQENDDSTNTSEIIDENLEGNQTEVESYIFSLTALSHCEILNEKIYIDAADACFKLEIFNSDNIKVCLQTEPEIEGMNVILIAGGKFVIEDYACGEITFTFDDLNITKSFEVVVK